MIKDYFRKTSSSLQTLTIPEVSVLLNFKNDQSTKKWLKNNGIQIHRLSKRNFIYQLDYDLVIGKPYVLGLRRKHPHNWKELSRSIVKDESLFNLMMVEIEGEIGFTPATKVSVKSKSDNKLRNSLLI